MDAKTTKMIGGFVGMLAGFFIGHQYSKPVEDVTTEIIDNVDPDSDDVNKQ